MDQGWIYVLVNSSMPGLAKVGRTARSPAERAAELSGVTSVPTPFVLVFDQPFDDCGMAERSVHAELDRRRLRAAPNREFFHGPVGEIIRLIQQAAEGQAPTVAPRIVSQADLLHAGDRHLYGFGETLQDTGEAVRFYRLAAARGALLAFERLGHVYVHLYAQRQNRAGRRRALGPLKEGARRGNYYCYRELAALFAAENHTANFLKSWDLFFARRADSFLAEAEQEAARFPAACRAYIGGCLDLGLEPRHCQEMRVAGQAIVSGQLAELDRVRGMEASRHQAIGVLRWIYLTLLRAPVETPVAARPAHRFWARVAGRAAA